MRPSAFLFAVLAEAKPDLPAARKVVEETDPASDLNDVHSRLLDSLDGQRRWYAVAKEQDRDAIVYEVQRQLTVQGWDVDVDRLTAFMAGDDGARCLAYPPTGADEFSQDGSWEDRYHLEPRQIVRKGFWWFDQVLTPQLVCVQAAVPRLLAEEERAELEDAGPLLLHVSEFALRRGVLITAIMVSVASEAGTEAAVTTTVARWSEGGKTISRALPLGAEGTPVQGLSHFLSDAELDAKISAIEHFRR